MIEFTIPINPITKKNSQVIIPVRTKTGKERHIAVPSAAYRKFEKECKPYVEEIKNKYGVIHYPIQVTCIFYQEKRLRIDLTNLLESIDDILCVGGLITDDNRDIIASHDGSRVYHDKYRPRVEIKITELPDYEQWKDTKNTQTSLF